MSLESASPVRTGAGDGAAGPRPDSAANTDHLALERLLEALERVCRHPRADGSQCGLCPGSAAHSCRDVLKKVCAGMRDLLLDHIQREQTLMNTLPRGTATVTHCERHRREHLKFSTRYNLLAVLINDCHPVVGARELEALAVDWIRGHAREYDAELAALLARAAPAQRHCA